MHVQTTGILNAILFLLGISTVSAYLIRSSPFDADKIKLLENKDSLQITGYLN